MKANVFLVASVSLFALSGCATSVVSSSNVAETAAIDRDMPRSGKSPYGALPALEANPTPVRLEP